METGYKTTNLISQTIIHKYDFSNFWCEILIKIFTQLSWKHRCCVYIKTLICAVCTNQHDDQITGQSWSSSLLNCCLQHMKDDVHQFIDVCVFCTCMHEICFHLCFESWSGRSSQRLQGRDSDIRATCTAQMNKSIKVSLCFTESHSKAALNTVIILMEHNYAIIIMFVPQYENTSATQHEHNQYLITKQT